MLLIALERLQALYLCGLSDHCPRPHAAIPCFCARTYALRMRADDASRVALRERVPRSGGTRGNLLPTKIGRFPRAVFTTLVLAKVFSLRTLLSKTARIIFRSNIFWKNVIILYWVTGSHTGGSSAPTPARRTMSGEWKSGLFGCIDEPVICLQSWFCPCVTYGQIAELGPPG